MHQLFEFVMGITRAAFAISLAAAEMKLRLSLYMAQKLLKNFVRQNKISACKPQKNLPQHES
jgi:hypothetical protein